jgi:hypothetical protein
MEGENPKKECTHTWKKTLTRKYTKEGRLSEFMCVECDERRRFLKKKNGEITLSQWKPVIIDVRELEHLLHPEKRREPAEKKIEELE